MEHLRQKGFFYLFSAAGKGSGLKCNKMNEKLFKTLKSGAEELGVDLTEEALARLDEYLGELKAWNRKINLTAIDTDSEVVTKHFLDSLTPYRYLKGAARLLDIGAGAGFPGLVLKIADPSIDVVLMDSVEKKVHFMRHVIRKLGLKGASAIAGRAGDMAVVESHRGAFDVVISRAFSELGGFLALAGPYLAPGGLVIAMKGPKYAEELKGTAGLKGFSPPETHEVRVPFTDRTTAVIIFHKEDT